MVASLYCCSLPLIRLFWTGEHTHISQLFQQNLFSKEEVISTFKFEVNYLFLWWNLLLAWVPVLVCPWLLKSLQANNTLNLSTIFFGIIWLLFFPNAPYLFTDLIHLPNKVAYSIPIWFDALMIYSFAFLSMFLGFLSLSMLQKQIRNSSLAWTFSYTVLILSSFGIYLGRFPRLNSWDLFFNPMKLFIVAFQSLISNEAQMFCVLVSFFLITCYTPLYLFCSNFSKE